jgi:hypothetical protein
LPVDAIGPTGPRRLFAQISPGDGALGVTADRSDVYVSLVKANRILILAPDGRERARVVSSDADPVPLDAPSGIAVSGTRLLITNESATNDANDWAVLTAAL